MTTSLELGCDCLGEITYVDAVLTDSRGRAVHDHERHLPARGGRRRAVEARRREGRRRGPPVPADGRVLPRHRRELRVPDLLALLPGRHHRVRGPGHRDHGHQLVRRRAPRRRAPWWTTRPTRRSTSTSSSPAWTWRSTGRRTPSWSPRARRCRSPTATPTAWRWCSAAARWRPSPRAGRTTTGPRQRGWKVVNRGRLNRLGTPTGYKLVASASFPALVDRELTDHGAGRGHRPHPLGHAVRRGGALARGRVLQPEPRLRGATGVDGGRPVRSPTPTSCCGTSSASTTSRGPRTGRSCRWTRSRSR